MSVGDWAATVAGGALLAAALVDLSMTLFHYDRDGAFSRPARRLIWSGMVRLAGSRRRLRRHLLGLSGLAMVVTNFVLWIGALTLGFALVVWPHIGTSFRGEPELGELGFVDALYFSGSTVSVLGLGDISPLGTPMKVLVFVESAVGFFVFTSIVTYVITLLSSATRRNAFVNHVRRMSGGGWDGARLVARALRAGSTRALASRFGALADQLTSLEEKLHNFPIADLYYRSRQADHDPEPAISCLAETVVLGHLLARSEPELLTSVEELDGVLDELMELMARQHFGPGARARFRASAPGPGDSAWVDRLRRALEASAPTELRLSGLEVPDRALEFAASSRVFLDELDRVTRFRVDHPRPRADEEPPSGD